MKIQSLLSSTKIKIFAFLLVVVLFVVIFGLASTKNNRTQIGYHQSRWNEYAPRIEKAFMDEAGIGPAHLKHVYGIVVSHHIPTTIPKLVEFYNRLKKTQSVKNFIVIGPDHTDSGLAPVTVSNESFFTTFGEVKPIDGLSLKLDGAKLAHIEESPFDPEHSIGSQMLIISKIFPGAKVTPIIIRSDTTKNHAEALGRILAENLDDETVLVASVDFSHYLSTTQAAPIDKISGEIVKNLDLDALSLITADSNKSMTVFIEAMRNKNAYDTNDFVVLNTNDLMQNSDFTTGYVFGFWGIK